MKWSWPFALVIGVVAAGLFWLGRCTGGGEDPRDVRADSIRAAAIDSMVTLRWRDSLRLVFQAREGELIARERDDAHAREVRLTTILATIQRTAGGGGIIRVDTSHPPEVIGPQALGVIDSLVAANLQLRGIVDRQGTLIDSLQVGNADLRKGIDQAHFALIESREEVKRLKARKAGGWRDRIRPKIGIGYAAIRETSTGAVRHGPGVAATWTIF